MYNNLLDNKTLQENKVEHEKFFSLELEKVTLSNQRSDILNAQAETLEYVKARNHAMGIDDASTGPVILSKTLKQFTDKLNLLERESNLRQQEISGRYINNLEQLSNEYEKLELSYRDDQQTIIKSYYDDSSKIQESVLLSNKEKNNKLSSLDKDYVNTIQQIQSARAEQKMKAEEQAFQRNFSLMKEYADQQGMQYTIAGNELIPKTDTNGMPIPTFEFIESSRKLELSMKELEKEYSESLGYYMMFDENGNMAVITDDNGQPMAYKPDRYRVDPSSSALLGYLVNKYGESIPDVNGKIRKIIVKKGSGSGSGGSNGDEVDTVISPSVSKIMGYTANKYGQPLYFDPEGTEEPRVIYEKDSIDSAIKDLLGNFGDEGATKGELPVHPSLSTSSNTGVETNK